MDMAKWDNGEAVFSLLANNSFFKWDSRDIYSIEKAQKIISKLIELDPTKMVAVSYASLLLNTAFSRASVTLHSAVLNDDFIQFAATLRAHKDELDNYANPLMENFISRVQHSCQTMTGSCFLRKEEAKPDTSGYHNLIDKNAMVKLLRDAVMSTEMPVHWLYSDGRPTEHRIESISLQSDILQYTNLADLVEDIRGHALPYGFRYVTVNASTSQSNSMNFIVYTSPSHAFIMSEIHWDKYKSKMTASSDAYQFHLDGVDYWEKHYPKLDSKNQLVPARERKLIIGSLNSVEDKQKVWLLMLSELMALKLPSLVPGNNLISTGLLLTDRSNTNMPVVLDKPFEIEHMTMEQAIEKVGIYRSRYVDTYKEIITNITIDILLPRENTVLRKSDYALLKEIPEHHTRTHIDTSKYLVLLPYPTDFFGDKEATTEAINYVLFSNLVQILNNQFALIWDCKRDEHYDWFESMMKKKHKHIKDKWNSFLEVRSSNQNCIMYDEALFDGFSSGERRLAIKQLPNWCLLTVAPGVPTLYKVDEFKDLIGFYTEDEDFERFILVPENTQEIMEIFNCRKSSLPRLLQNWERCKNHDYLKYPWTSKLSLVAGWIYY